jgi:hypothetical protein
MIITKLQGGLGNQMFQYAVGRSLSHRLGVSLKIDATYYENDRKRECMLNHLNTSAEVATKEEIIKIKPNSFFHKIKQIFFGRNLEQKMFQESYFFKSEILNLPDNTYLEGFWQNENYFKDIENILRTEFVLKENLPNTADTLLKSIDTSNSVSIHIRRGDYALPKYQKIFYPLTIEYYNQAIILISKKISDPQFFVFSDDIEWAETLSFPKNTTFVDSAFGLKNFEELIVMSKCKHNILANSSFSWWAGWLNTNPNKIIIAPKKWSTYQIENERDLIPKTWTKI